jgi:hypothetical protein
VRGTDRRNRSDRASRATRRIERHRFVRSLPGLPSCTVACSGTVFRYARPEPSRPGREMRSFPHACIFPAALVGFSGALRRFAPASGRPAHLCPATAHLPVSSTSPRPIDFRRADFAALRKGTIRAKGAAKSGEIWMLASGQLLLRSVSASFFFFAGEPILPWAFASCRVGGHATCCAFVRARPRTDHLSPRTAWLGRPCYPLMGLGGRDLLCAAVPSAYCWDRCLAATERFESRRGELPV